MKKILLTTIAVLLAVALNAQVSVWDGSYEMWDTIHAGTEDDPILIENAAQFAYLNYHKTPFCYYKLMTDIDFDNRDWYPIGYSSMTYVPFHGIVDCNGHTIYHLTTTLFGDIEEGGIKNLTIRDSEIVRKYGWNIFGGIAMIAPFIENCHNYADVILDYNDDHVENWRMGGIAGSCRVIINCSNHGNIKVTVPFRLGSVKVGGIAGTAGTVISTVNTGEMIFTSDMYTCIVGGICGQLFNKAQYCYNTTDLSVACDESYAGGIVGSIYNSSHDTVFINSCYFAGVISADNIGGIIAKNDYPSITIIAGDSYYINTISSDNDFGTPKSEDEMKSEDFVSLLNTDEEMFFMDTYGYINSGYPILKWQHESHVGVDETDWNGNVEVYPNPTDGVLTINGENLKELEVVNILGQTVLKASSETDKVTVDLENHPSGIYLLKLTDAKGGKQTVKIVVKH